MSLREVVFENPAVLGVACLAWIGVAIWVVSLIGWMITGDVEPLFGFAAMALASVLGFWAFKPPVEWLRTVSMLSLFATMFVFPLLRRALNQRALAGIDIEALENQYEILRLKPDNWLAKFKIAKILFERGQVEPAIAVGADALRHMPEQVFTEEHRMFARWRRLSPHAAPTPSIACIDCGFENPAFEVFCQNCGKPYLLERTRGRWAGRDFVRKMLAGWVAGIVALAGIPFAATLPPLGAITVILTLMAGAIFFLVLAFRHKEGAT